MPAFTYKAKDGEGKVVTGSMIAESEREVLFSLDRQGLFPLELAGQQEQQPTAVAARKSGKRIRAHEIITFTRELADLLKAGVALDRALTVIAQNTPNQRMVQVIEDIQKEISKGQPLNQALRRHPKLFPDFFSSMVKAGEAGGFLEDVLVRISNFAEKDEELRSKIRTSLAYPILLSVIGIAAVVFLMVFFIPRFSMVFAQFGATLPVMTQIVIGFSTFTKKYLLLILAAVLGVVVGIRQYVATPAGRDLADRIKLRTPVLGTLLKKRAIARFARTFGTLLKSGVPIVEALHIAKEAMGNVHLMRDIDQVAVGIKRGDKVGQLLARSRFIPAIVSSMVTVGEESGNLDEVLVGIADSYDVQVDRTVKVLVSLFEPMLLVFMAAIVGFIVVSMLLPVFTLSTMVK